MVYAALCPTCAPPQHFSQTLLPLAKVSRRDRDSSEGFERQQSAYLEFMCDEVNSRPLSMSPCSCLARVLPGAEPWAGAWACRNLLADTVKAFECLNCRGLKAWFLSLTETKFVLWMRVKGVPINFSPSKHETTSACYVWPSHHSSRNAGSTCISEAHPRLGADPGFSSCKSPNPPGAL